jgi:phospholipid transport system transporter-binding protein
MYRPNAPIHMANARQALEDGVRAIQSGEQEFSLAELGGSDSSAIAVLLDWQRQAHKNGLNFLDVPATLTSFAALYGVDTLLSGFAAPHSPHQ